MRVYKRPITDISSLHSAVRRAKNRFSGQVWWRGQRNYSWSLRPSIFRSHEEYDEVSGILRFQQRAVSRHPHVQPISDRSSWLFVMQHYRLPTRLLDWTESPLIAAFFASEMDKCHERYPDKISDPDGALFALSPYKLNEFQAGSDGLFMPEDDETKIALAPAFDRDAAEVTQVIAIRPSEVDVRLMVQISEFTLNGYDIALEDLSLSDQFLMKFRVSSNCKLELREELKRMGVKLSSIFPDLEHLAEEIRDLAFKKIEPTDQESGSSLPDCPKYRMVWISPDNRGGERST
jgi:hypothetical protein